ncbi:MAG: GNVR domain-containing protein [Gammaproteobacteria bacterium]
MENFGQNVSTTDQVWGALKRRRWLATLLFACAFAVIASIAYSLPDYYRGSASILINQIEGPASIRSSVSTDLEPRLYTVTQRVTSRDNLMRLIDEEELYPDAREKSTEHALVERMRRDISIERERVDVPWGRDSTIAFTLTYRGFDRDSVAHVTNRIAELYVGENSSIRNRQVSDAASFLKAQLDNAKTKLDERERAINAYRESRLGELPEQQSANLATLERLNAQLRMNNENQLRTMERRRELAARLDAEGYSTPDGSSTRVSRLRQELADLRTRYSEHHPDVIRVQAEIDGISSGSGRTSTALPSALGSQITRLDEELEALRREESRLKNSTTVYEQRIANTPRREQELSALTRDYNAIREQYTELLASYEDALLAESLEQGNPQEFQIMDYAVAPDEPAGPPRTRLLLMGFVVSLMLAGAGVVIAEQLDSSFHSIDELKSFTGVPVVAGIPRIITLGDLVRDWVRVGASVTAAVALLSVLVVGGYLYGTDNTALVSMMTGRAS